MKAADVTEPGFYWYFAPGEPTELVEFHTRDHFDRMGTEIPYNDAELPGQFIGPVVYPGTASCLCLANACSQTLDDHARAVPTKEVIQLIGHLGEVQHGPYKRAGMALEQLLRQTRFQDEVLVWMVQCFGVAIASDIRERGDRLLEEVFELLQAHGYDPARVATLRDYVWGRPVGQPAQELGGVMVTLAAFSSTASLDMATAARDELARVWAMIPTIRAKQQSKRDIHGPLPE